MTEPAPETPPPFDPSLLVAQDEPPIPDPPGRPDPRASRERRSPRGLFGKPVGDQADTPPSRRAARAPKSKPRKIVPNRKGQFVAPLTALYSALGLGLMPFDAVCGNAILNSAEKCAESIDELAYRNEAVRRAVFALVQTSALGAVIVAHMPIILAVAMHHVPVVQRVMGDMGSAMAESIAQQMANASMGAEPEGGDENAA